MIKHWGAPISDKEQPLAVPPVLARYLEACGAGFEFWVLGFGFGFMVQGLGRMVWGSKIGVGSSGFGVQDWGFRVWGSGFGVQGLGSRVWGSEFTFGLVWGEAADHKHFRTLRLD